MAGHASVVVLVGVIFTAVCPGVLSNTITLIMYINTTYEGGLVDYVASSPVSTTISDIRWTVNGVPLSELPDVNHDPIMKNTRHVGLTIRNVSADLNGHIISCTAILSTGVNATCNPPQVIQVQGILNPVVNLTSQCIFMDDTVNIFWTPPAAITVPPARRPEIFYCIEIRNSTGTERIGCNKTVDRNENTNIVLRDVVYGSNYDITVTPFNRLGDGAAVMVVFPDSLDVADRNKAPQLNGNSFTYTYEVLGLVCSCSAVIQDASVGGSLLCNINTPGLLTITTENVPPNKKFNIQLCVNNSKIFTTKEDLVSTFDSDLTISSIGSTAEYSLTFVGGSTAKGVFIAILFMDGQFVDFSQSLYFTQERSRAEMTNQLMGLSIGRYEVLAYDVESSGEITSENPADQMSVTVTESSVNSTSLQILNGIRCNFTKDRIAVNVMCEFNVSLYSGYRVYIQHTSDVLLRFIESTVSGEMVSINGSLVGGEHLVMVYPIWSSDIPDGRLAPALRVVYNLDASKTLPSTTSEASTVLPADSSSSPFPDPTTSSSPPVVGPSGPIYNMATIIGVIVMMVVVIIIAAVLIIFVVIILVRWSKKRKIVFLEKGEVQVSFGRDGQQSPSADNEIPLYNSANPPPKMSKNDQAKANKDEAPLPPSGAAALYSSVNVNKKKTEKHDGQRSLSADNEIPVYNSANPPPKESISDQVKTNENEAPSCTSCATALYSTVNVNEKKKEKEQGQEQDHQEPQYEIVQLKLQKPSLEKGKDEHLVQYSTIDNFKKVEPDPKEETPRQDVKNLHFDESEC